MFIEELEDERGLRQLEGGMLGGSKLEAEPLNSIHGISGWM